MVLLIRSHFRFVDPLILSIRSRSGEILKNLQLGEGLPPCAVREGEGALGLSLVAHCPPTPLFFVDFCKAVLVGLEFQMSLVGS